MKIVPLAVAGAAVIAVTATTVFAQTAQPAANPNTKVYAYKQAAPKAQNTIAPAIAPAMPGAAAMPQQKPFEYLPEAVPFGSHKWWEIQSRGAGGAGGD